MFVFYIHYFPEPFSPSGWRNRDNRTRFNKNKPLMCTTKAVKGMCFFFSSKHLNHEHNSTFFLFSFKPIKTFEMSRFQKDKKWVFAVPDGTKQDGITSTLQCPMLQVDFIFPSAPWTFLRQWNRRTMFTYLNCRLSAILLITKYRIYLENGTHQETNNAVYPVLAPHAVQHRSMN